MIPRRISGFNSVLGAPKGWNKGHNGNCAGLAVRVVGDLGTMQVQYKSAWEPTLEEIEILKKGGSVILTVHGGQPPVMLTVEPSVEE